MFRSWFSFRGHISQFVVSAHAQRENIQPLCIHLILESAQSYSEAENDDTFVSAQQVIAIVWWRLWSSVSVRHVFLLIVGNRYDFKTVISYPT